MKRQSLVLLAVAFLAAGAAGCFSDPVSSLQKSPSRISLDHQSVFLATGDSVPVVATLKDNFGDALPATGAAWTSGDQSVATVRMDTTVVPGNYFTRAFISAVSTSGGTTNVIVTARGISDTVRVTVLPTAFSGALLAFEGTVKPDTIGSVAFQAPDTLVVNGSNVLLFDPANVSAYVIGPAGAVTGYVISADSTKIKVVFTQPAAGRLVLKNLVLKTGNADVGPIALDSLLSDSVLVSRIRFNGTFTQAGDTTTVTAAAPYTFSSSTGVKVGSASGLILSQSSSALSFLTTSAGSGGLTLSKPKIAGVTLTSLSGNGTFTTTAATFPGAVAVAGDTLTVAAGTNAAFDSTTTVSVGSTATTIFDTTGQQLRVVIPATLDTMTNLVGKVSVKNVVVSGAHITLPTPTSYTLHAARFPGAVAVVGDTITATTAPATNISLNATKSTIKIKTTSGIILSQSTSSISAISLKTVTGSVTISRVKLGMATLTLITPLNTYAINAATFPGSIVSPGRLLDTIRVYSTANTKFTSESNVEIAGSSPAAGNFEAFIVYQDADSMLVIPRVASNDAVTVTNVEVGGVAVSALNTTANVVVSGTNTGDVTTNVDGTTALDIGATAAGTYDVYGAANDSSNTTRYYKFTLAAASPEVGVKLSFVGDGSGDADNPGMDVVLCKTLTAANTCTYQLDLMGGAASVTTEPEEGSAAELAAGTYYIAVFVRPTTNGNVAYQIQVTVN